MGTHNQDLGRFGEDAAARWYAESGYAVIDRNWRCDEGEVDLIVAFGAVVVFVEVKARSSGRFGSGFDAVTRTKQRRLRRLASRWLVERRAHVSDGGDAGVGVGAGFASEVRFDVVDVNSRGHVQVRHGCF